MAYTPVEIIALVFALLILIKLVVLMIKPKAWMDSVAFPIYRNPAVSGGVFAILAAVIFYYLIAELTIVQIFATVAFTSFMMSLGLLVYSKEILVFAQKVAQKFIKKGFTGTQWVITIVWLILALWVLKDLLM